VESTWPSNIPNIFTEWHTYTPKIENDIKNTIIQCHIDLFKYQYRISIKLRNTECVGRRCDRGIR